MDTNSQEQPLTEPQEDTEDEWYNDVAKMMRPVNTAPADTWDLILQSRKIPSPEDIMIMELSAEKVCLNRHALEALISAHNYGSWLASQLTPFGIPLSRAMPPLSADHLLTLTHFNTMRGMLTLVLTLGVDPMLMETDLMSPFVTTVAGPKLASTSVEVLPPILHPTALQKVIPHHPELDVMPFPGARDNLIRAMDRYSMHELCLDIIGVTGSLESVTEELGTEYEQNVFCTGLLLWGDPLLPSSWEVTENFARKWAWVFTGCQEAVVSTNYWRSRRGERPLVFEEVAC